MTTVVQAVGPDLAPIPSSRQPLTAVNLDTVTAKQVVYMLVQQPGPPHAQLLIDCSTLQALRTLGVSHVVSELLLLRQCGAQVWLRNMSPTLHQCLRLLRLDQVLLFVD